MAGVGDRAPRARVLQRRQMIERVAAEENVVDPHPAPLGERGAFVVVHQLSERERGGHAAVGQQVHVPREPRLARVDLHAQGRALGGAPRGIEVSSEEHSVPGGRGRPVERDVEPALAGKRLDEADHLKELGVAQELVLPIVGVPHQVGRGHQDVPTDLPVTDRSHHCNPGRPQTGHLTIKVSSIPGLLRGGNFDGHICWVHKIKALAGDKREARPLPEDSTAVLASARALGPHSRVPMFRQCRPEKRRVVELRERQHRRVIPQHLQQQPLAPRGPAEKLIIDRAQHLQLVVRDEAAPAVLKGVGVPPRAVPWRVVRVEDLLLAGGAHVDPVQEPRLEVAAQVAGKHVVLLHQEGRVSHQEGRVSFRRRRLRQRRVHVHVHADAVGMQPD
mmetsp:Transcript_48782/g.139552  ORF Transcript_48782/g.139552 Transcript_48782/m.139552 type:complete len:390 (+) Transcript_48782:211-1380(+)